MAKPQHVQISAEARRIKVLSLMMTNRTQRQMARELDVSQALISKDIAAIRNEWAERRALSYEAHVDAELARLAEVEASLWERVISGNDDWAIDRWLKIFAERAKILGLYAPERHRVVTVTELDEQIAALEAELGANDSASANSPGR